MYYTLLELERIYKCPMIVRDGFNHTWYLILKPESVTSNFYEGKAIAPNQTSALPGTPATLVSGFYSRFVYIGKPKEEGISPEDQKRILLEERKRNNDKIIRYLKQDGKKKALTIEAKRIQRLKGRDPETRVIPITRKKEQKDEAKD